MISNIKNFERVLVAGSGRLVASIAVCLLKAGHEVILCSDDNALAQDRISQHAGDLAEFESFELSKLSVLDEPAETGAQLAILHTEENMATKRQLIATWENYLDRNTIIAINSESVPLEEISSSAKDQSKIIGVNWSEPAHTTFFLEIFCSENTSRQAVADLFELAKTAWQKDPYLLQNGRGIRSRMMAAMLREAFYLVENDYVRIEDIDRACRNDAGYYLPFAGNFRYMDLMGGYLYGVVMQDLNPELSKETRIPAFCQEILTEKNRTFYEYGEGEAEEWENKFRVFTYEIRNIIAKYHSDLIPQLHPAL